MKSTLSYIDPTSNLKLPELESHSYARTSLIVSRAALRAGITLAIIESTITTPNHRTTPNGVKTKAKVEPAMA
jgi:hypothetical protein